jgi:F-type H+-transporting ATPase subunit b
MDKLLSPDIGLAVWTILSFLIFVVLLRVLAWKPLLGAVEARESGLRSERERAEKARDEAEKIQAELEKRLTGAKDEAKGILAEANKDGEKLRAELKKVAEDESKAIVEKTRAQLAEEKNRLVGELRSEVATLSVLAAERLVKKSVDAGVQKSVLDGFFADLEKQDKVN